MPEWTWDTEDFAALWYDDANDRFPRPLKYLSRFAHQNELDRHRSTVRARYSHDELTAIRAALHTLSTSDMRIEIYGGTRKHRDSTGDVKEYRIIGARNTFHAVVASKVSAAKPSAHPPAHLPPRNPRQPHRRRHPGLPTRQSTPVTFYPNDLRPQQDTYLHDNARNTPRERYKRLIHRPADGGANAELYVGPLYTRPDPTAALQWYDFTGDGRYTDIRTHNITIRPTTPTDLTTTFTTWLNRATQRLREQASW
ncbi:ESX secretion-associated protein EspG [Nocardia goodfellowii]